MFEEKSSGINFGLVLLAAGASSRLGMPKQLLTYEDRVLLQHSLEIAVNSNAHPIVVVLGAHAERIEGEIDSSTVQVVVNEAWQEGMASSIRCGVNTLLELSPLTQGLILMVCDQPHVTTSLLNDLIGAHQNTGRPIVTCTYAETFGPPTLFHKHIFPELLHLTGDVGARNVLQEHAGDVEVVQFPKGALDIDTIEDYEKLKKSTLKS